MVECSDASSGASGGASPLCGGSLASRAFHARSLLATIQVHFIGYVPASIWQFSGVSPFAHPQKNANQYNRTRFNTHGQAALTQPTT
jgi:hypothetical protein